MVKPLSEFGGWLRFFQVGIVISFIINIYSLIVYLLALFKTTVSFGILVFSLHIAQAVVSLVVAFLIFRRLQIQTPETPIFIWKFLTVIFGVSIFINLIIVVSNLIFNSWAFSSLDPRLAYPFVVSIAGYAIWANYFKVSKRVYSHYGNNA